jgi:hypothetical protein
LSARSFAKRRWAILLALSAALCVGPSGRGGAAGTGDRAGLPAAVADPPDPDTSSAVQAEMRNIHFEIAPGVVLNIARLRGALLPIGPERPPTLDDKHSYSLLISTAEISIDTASLGNLLSNHVFAYPGSPLRSLRIETDGDELVQRGVLHGFLPFSMRATVTLTSEGLIRLRPRTVRVFGVGVRRLMRLFGLELENLAKVKAGRGVRIEGDDFLLDPTAILPPPRTRGRVTRLVVGNGRVAQTFGGAAPAVPLAQPGSDSANYMYFQGGTLRFGKLTMMNTDLLILDDDPSDPFDLNLDRYNDQLVAGYNRNTPDYGLIVYMPDRQDMLAKAQGHKDAMTQRRKDAK